MHILHLVSHTHWDREWYFTFQQFRLKLVHLIDNLLAILEADPNYKHFMLDGQTIVLDDYLQLRPEKAKTIRAHVQSGRLLIGPWHILPDEFLVSPEATIRNLLTGDRTAQRFGPKMAIGYIPDPFGHIGQMPQILKGFGIETAVFRRGLSDEPCELWWEGRDGTRLFTVYLREGYDNAAGFPTADPQRFVAEVCRARDALAPYSITPHMLLMHGTDHMEPPPDTIAALAHAANSHLDGDVLIHSTLPAFVNAVRSAIHHLHTAIPIVRGELRSPKRHHLLPGVLSTRMWIKQHNHACETLLEKWAEPFSTWASLIEKEKHGSNGIQRTDRIADPAPILRQAWRMLMECHPHDSICGCSVDQVHDEMRPRFDQVEQIGEEIARQSLETLAAAIDTAPAGVRDALAAVVIFNPVAGPRTDAVTTQVKLPEGVSDFEIMDEAGQTLPHQVVDNGGDILFAARDLPGYGYRTFRIRPAASRQPSAEGDSHSLTIENEFFAVEASPDDGTLTLRDKQTGITYRGLNRFVDGGDCGDEYNYCSPAADALIGGEVHAVRVERGSVQQSVEVLLVLPVPAELTADRKARSEATVPLAITTRAMLTRGVPRLDIHTEVDSPARDHRLRVHFPAPFAGVAADHDGHFEVVRREIGLPTFDDSWVERPRPEVPQRAFTDVSNGEVGLMIANRGLPEMEALRTANGGTELALTLLRCVGWLSRDDFPARQGQAGPQLPTPGAQMIGQWAFDYSIIPHSGGWQNAFHEAYAFNAPLRAVATTIHPGALPTATSFVRVALENLPENVGRTFESARQDGLESPPPRTFHTTSELFVVSALKEAEDGSGWIVRGYNIGAEAINVTLTPWQRFARAWRAMLDERAEIELTPDAAGGFTFIVRGHEIVTVKFSR